MKARSNGRLPRANPDLVRRSGAYTVGQFTVGEPRLKKDAENKELIELTYGDAGVDFYSNGLVASEATIKDNPDLVQRFVTATIKGLKYSLDNPKEAAEIMKKYHRELDIDLGAAERWVRVFALLRTQNSGPWIPNARRARLHLSAVLSLSKSREG